MTLHDMPLRDFMTGMARPTGAKQPALSQMAQVFLKRLDAFGIGTVGEFWGCLNPELPGLKNAGELATRGLSKSCRSKAQDPADGQRQHERRAKLLAQAVDVQVSSIRRLYDAINKLPPVYHAAKPARAEWFLGQRLPTAQNKAVFCREVPVRKLAAYRKVPAYRKIYFLPELHARLGDAWDQGERGTCVAQAAGGLVGYLAGGFIPSTQFIYHQSKMVDGIPAEEGTFLHVALQVLSDRTLADSKQAWNSSDLGVPDSRAWPYSPKFQPGNPAQTPPPKDRFDALYKGNRAFNAESKHASATILRCAEAKEHVVDDIRFLLSELKAPVMAGFPLYESFNNPNSRRTGKITLPLPGESLMGYHAMLVVGFDDERKLFLVRNSWGTAWAWSNPYLSGQSSLAGYACIPYAYLEKAGIEPVNAYSLKKVEVGKFMVEEAVRLYRKPVKRVAPLKPGSRAIAKVARQGSKQPSFLSFLRLS